MKYDDIIDLPHHVSETHPRMSLYDRAAQFSPFAALTGHEAAIRETARLTDRRLELDEDSRRILDGKLQLIQRWRREGKSIVLSVTYFQPDERKSGGSYVTVKGKVKKIKEYEKKLILEDDREISMENILEITGEEFREWEEAYWE